MGNYLGHRILGMDNTLSRLSDNARLVAYGTKNPDRGRWLCIGNKNSGVLMK